MVAQQQDHSFSTSLDCNPSSPSRNSPLSRTTTSLKLGLLFSAFADHVAIRTIASVPDLTVPSQLHPRYSLQFIVITDDEHDLQSHRKKVMIIVLLNNIPTNQQGYADCIAINSQMLGAFQQLLFSISRHTILSHIPHAKTFLVPNEPRISSVTTSAHIVWTATLLILEGIDTVFQTPHENN